MEDLRQPIIVPKTFLITLEMTYLTYIRQDKNKWIVYRDEREKLPNISYHFKDKFNNPLYIGDFVYYRTTSERAISGGIEGLIIGYNCYSIRLLILSSKEYVNKSYERWFKSSIRNRGSEKALSYPFKLHQNSYFKMEEKNLSIMAKYILKKYRENNIDFDFNNLK